MKAGDLILGLFIVMTVILMILPLSGVAISILITVNLLLSLVILFNSLFAREALDMSAFPTILLFTTMFRLALNVSSTRAILTSGPEAAGNVILTFGRFVGGNNLVVGIIVFFILVLINFLVITKGSERVAEVSARFTLDAMPGKQMAIDADLNSGMIDETQARKRREKIQDEASFFGSMDGAAKFVKGDAIAGLIITFVNILGGIVIGVVQLGMTTQEAMQQYTIVTIGDGLVSQIPALLISLATGILVTKVSKETEISDTVGRQLFTLPKVMYMAGGVLVFLGIVTPLSAVIVSGIGVLTVFAGKKMADNLKVFETQDEISMEEEAAEEIRKPENVINLLQVDPIELEFGYGIIPLADSSQGGDLLDRVVMIRRQIALELGAIVPIIRLRDNIQLSPNQYVIKIKGNVIAEGEILFDHYLAMDPGYVEEQIDGIETVEPAFHLPALWITENQRERAEAVGYTVVDPPSIIATHLTEVIKSHLDELITRQEVKNLINKVAEDNQTLIDELVPKLLTVGEIQKVLTNLLAEGVSIRDLVTIFETLADQALVTKDVDVLTEYARQSQKRSISNKFLEEQNQQVLTLDPAVESMIMESVKHSEQGTYLTLDPEVISEIVAVTDKAVRKLTDIGRMPIIITSPILRIYYKRIIQEQLPEVVVISYNEIDASTELQSVGMVSLS